MPRCSFCGSSTGPFREVEGLFTVLMCVGCQAARSPGLRPAELLADHNQGEPWLKWGCALCEYRAVEPEALEVHTTAEHPRWIAVYEVVRPYPQQLVRVVYRRVEGPPAS
jgi:hypothetical protein